MNRFRMRAIALVIIFAMAFSAAASMPMDVFAATSDFVIEDGVLTKYKGGGGDGVDVLLFHSLSVICELSSRYQPVAFARDFARNGVRVDASIGSHSRGGSS